MCNMPRSLGNDETKQAVYRAVFTWLSKGIGFGFGFGFGFTTPFGWLVYLLWFWFYDSQVKTALMCNIIIYYSSMRRNKRGKW